MPTSPVIESLTKVQEQILDTVAQAQEPVVTAVGKAVEIIDTYVPELPALPFADKLPTADELVSNQYDFARKVLDQQKAFAEALIEASRPVTAKVVAVADKPAKSTTKKAAA